MENIAYFRPTGEPDAPYDVVQGPPVMREVAVVGFAQSPVSARTSSS